LQAAAPFNLGGSEALALDCASDNKHYQIWHQNQLGTLVADAAIYANDGASYNAADAKHSWKIITTSYATYYMPYVTPWISVHHEGTSAITPYLEILRDKAGAPQVADFQNNEVWAEFMFKGTSDVPLGTLDNSDRMAVAGSPADQDDGVGLSGWTGAGSAYAWSGKLSPTAAITPVEIGDLCARVCVGASITVYADPLIRGVS
jgi:hypothetical protein